MSFVKLLLFLNFVVSDSYCQKTLAKKDIKQNKKIDLKFPLESSANKNKLPIHKNHQALNKVNPCFCPNPAPKEKNFDCHVSKPVEVLAWSRLNKKNTDHSNKENYKDQWHQISPAGMSRDN